MFFVFLFLFCVEWFFNRVRYKNCKPGANAAETPILVNLSDKMTKPSLLRCFRLKCHISIVLQCETCVASLCCLSEINHGNS